MQALVYDRNDGAWEQTRGLKKTEVQTPTLNEKQHPADADMALIRLRYAGVCGSDRSVWFRHAFKRLIHDSLDTQNSDIRIAGHEAYGELIALGSVAEEKFGYKLGDMFAIESHMVCGACYQCTVGDAHVCQNQRILGFSVDGCFAEVMKVPAKLLWSIDPSRIREEVASLLEPFGNAVHACTVKPLQGKTVAILGCGPIGMFVIGLARSLGARQIIGVEPVEKHAKMAMALGADHVLFPSLEATTLFEHDPDISSKIRDLTGGIGVDIAFEMSGYNISLNNAIHSVRSGGDVVLFGIKSGNFVIETMEYIIMNGISFHSIVGRLLWDSWNIGYQILGDPNNDLQEKIYTILLKQGEGTIIPFGSLTSDIFEKAMESEPKMLLKMI